MPSARSPRADQGVCVGVSCTAYSSRSPSLLTTMTLEVSGQGSAVGTKAKEVSGRVKVFAESKGSDERRDP